MQSKDVRKSFLDFFRTKGHQIIPGTPVIPAQDPTLLFTNAGMNQFKDVFLGTGKREYKRVANSQKCIRVSGKHNDLEEVGVDTCHHTFFEMLGNWSFGDYYKREAIRWAWELFTEVWNIDSGLLYASVYEEDNEAEELWYAETGITQGRVKRYGVKDNFWEMADVGPCGPCSELFYDLGAQYACGPECAFGCECGRFIEIWNLVFIQYSRADDGSLTELPEKHVDTGMGLERITAVLQGKRSNYDTDLFSGMMGAIADITGREYEEESSTGVAFRVISDHIRALTFAIADGAVPSNEGRGYVLRRILRRAARYSRDLNMREPFMYKLVAPLVECMGDAYPEIRERKNYIETAIRSEEEGFGKTLDRGIAIFNTIAEETSTAGSGVIPGGEAFKLYDTYGFPLDLTELMARERNLRIDHDGFEREMAAQRERSQRTGAVRALDKLKTTGVKTRFVYTCESLTTTVASIFDEEGKEISEAHAGTSVEIQLAGETPFYAEAGGQVGDTGFLVSEEGTTRAEVFDTQKLDQESIFHYARIVGGTLRVGSTVTASIDSDRRQDIKRNHTATHLLHKALREVLGPHVKQAGSLVAPAYLRFDFNHFHKLTEDELAEVERRVNDAIRRNSPVVPEDNVPIEKAKTKGAMALFGEKYGDRVRTITIGDYSIELCGGTHIESTGLIGEFRIVSESAAAAGVRRIVAETGTYSYETARRERWQLERIKKLLNARDDEAVTKLKQLLSEKNQLEKKLKDARQRMRYAELDRLIADAKKTGDPHLITHQFSVSSLEELKEFGDVIRGKMPDGAALLGARVNKKGLMVCVVGDKLIKEKNWDAGTIISRLSKTVGGGGGGKAHMATAGIRNAEKLEKAFSLFPDVAESTGAKNPV